MTLQQVGAEVGNQDVAIGRKRQAVGQRTSWVYLASMSSGRAVRAGAEARSACCPMKCCEPSGAMRR